MMVRHTVWKLTVIIDSDLARIVKLKELLMAATSSTGMDSLRSVNEIDFQTASGNELFVLGRNI